MSYTFLLHPPPTKNSATSKHSHAPSSPHPSSNNKHNKRRARSSTLTAISAWASQVTAGSPTPSSASPQRSSHPPSRPPPTPLTPSNFLSLADTPTTATTGSYISAGRINSHLRSGSGSWSFSRPRHSPRSPSLRSIDTSGTHAQNVLSEQGYAYAPTVFIRLPSSPRIEVGQAIPEETKEKEAPSTTNSSVKNSFSRLRSFTMFSRMRVNSQTQSSSQVAAAAAASVAPAPGPKSASAFVSGFHIHSRSKSTAVVPPLPSNSSSSHPHSSKSSSTRPSTSQGHDKETRDRDRERRHEHSSRQKYATAMPLDLVAEIQLVQLLDGGSTAASTRRVQERRARMVERQLDPTTPIGYSGRSASASRSHSKHSKSSHRDGSKPGQRDIVGGGVSTVYKDERGGLWWDEDERWESVGLLEAVGKTPTSKPPKAKKEPTPTPSSVSSGSASSLFDGEVEGSGLSASTSSEAPSPRENSAERKLRHASKQRPIPAPLKLSQDNSVDEARRAFLADSFAPFPASDSNAREHSENATKKVIDAPDRSTSLPPLDNQKGRKSSARDLRSMFKRNASARV